jgi:16S rRNA (cytosine967-C5)-methyltransferase
MNPSLVQGQFGALVQALEEVLPAAMPADVALHQFFRSNPGLGAHDRAFVADGVYGALRRIELIRTLTPLTSARRVALAALSRVMGRSTRELLPFCQGDEREWLESLKTRPSSHALHVQADLPEWVAARLLRQWSSEEVLALGRSLQSPAPLDLRVNTLKARREEALQALENAGIKGQPTPWSPLGIRLQGRPAINRLPLFLEGGIEVQDEGSQILGFLTAPRRRDMVVDFCAGAGGKTLMMGALMNNQGRLYAFDVSERRLNNLKPRLKRSGLSNVNPVLISRETDARVKRLAGKIDRVLVDAPCSGLGTLRRNPDLKLRQNEASVSELVAKQHGILHAAASLVKKGGRLIYATCSLLAEENEFQADRFSAEHPEFTALHCGEILASQQIPLEMGERLQLLPHRHDTDGFFAAVWERRA